MWSNRLRVEICMTLFASIQTSDRYVTHRAEGDSDMVKTALLVLKDTPDTEKLEHIISLYGASFESILEVAEAEAGE